MFSCLLVVISLLALVSNSKCAQYNVTILTGTVTDGQIGNNIPASSARVGTVRGIWVDSIGGIFITDSHMVRQISIDGIITRIGGTGGPLISNSGGAFTSVSLYDPWGIQGDNNFLYISDTYHVWKYNRTSGIVSILTGTGTLGMAGDGVPATSAQIAYPKGLWLTSNNDLYIAEDPYGRVRKIDLNTSIITTVVGGGSFGFGGDGGPALSTNTRLNSPFGVYIDTKGVIFIADHWNSRIRYVVDGIINTYAGGGPSQNIADGFAATDAYLKLPFDVKGDTLGNIFVAVEATMIRVVDYSTKIVTTYLSLPADSQSLCLDYHSGRMLVGMRSYLGTASLLESTSQPSSYPSSRPSPHPTTSQPTSYVSLRPSAKPTMSPTPTFKPTRYPSFSPTVTPSLSPTVKNDDEVKVTGTCRVKFVSGQTLTILSVRTLSSAFQNISDNAQSTEIVSKVLVGQSSPQSSSIRGGVRRGLTASPSQLVSDQAIPSQPSYTHDISFSSRYVMTYHGSYSSSQVMSQKKTTIRQAIEGGKFESVLRYLARAKNATQLLNVSCREVTSLHSVIVSPASSSKSDNEGSLSKGALVGIVIGVVVGSLVVATVVYVTCYCQTKGQKIGING